MSQLYTTTVTKYRGESESLQSCKMVISSICKPHPLMEHQTRLAVFFMHQQYLLMFDRIHAHLLSTCTHTTDVCSRQEFRDQKKSVVSQQCRYRRSKDSAALKFALLQCSMHSCTLCILHCNNAAWSVFFFVNCF